MHCCAKLVATVDIELSKSFSKVTARMTFFRKRLLETNENRAKYMGSEASSKWCRRRFQAETSYSRLLLLCSVCIEERLTDIKSRTEWHRAQSTEEVESGSKNGSVSRSRPKYNTGAPVSYRVHRKRNNVHRHILV